MALSTAVDPSARARGIGIKTEFSDLRAGRTALLPQRIAVIGQGSTAATYATTKKQVLSAVEAGETYGFGSPVHLAVKQLLPANGDGVGTIPVTVYPLEDDGGGTPATGAVTPAGTATAAGSFRLLMGGVLSEAVSVAVGDVVADVVTSITAAINAQLDGPLVATDNVTSVIIVSKWEGASANGIVVEIVGDAPAGVTIGFTQPFGGTVDPAPTGALSQFGEVWETMVLICMLADTTMLDEVSAFGEGRWGASVHKPFIAFTGITTVDVASAIVVSDARTTDRVNARLSAPGSPDLPFMVAARELARILVVANTVPAKDYGGQQATGINPGTDGEQWDYLERDTAVKAGTSTAAVKGGIVTIEDVVTFFHPVGDLTPLFRYVSSIVKMMQVLYNTALIFESPGWNGAPLIPDDQFTNLAEARQPKAAVAAINAMIDSLGAAAIISNPDDAKKNTAAEIDDTNPNRMNVSITVQLSGNTGIISIDQQFAFFFGG